tara:strand:- start:5230 stop:5382 length:153 start_codon:yes stop_codon:yes gene_type:complete
MLVVVLFYFKNPYKLIGLSKTLISTGVEPPQLGCSPVSFSKLKNLLGKPG